MQKTVDYKNIKKIGLVVRPNSNLDKEIVFLKKMLEKRKIKLLLLQGSSENVNLPNLELNEFFKQSDFVISLGGDGTLISLCRKACEYERAILGIHAGHLGFLTNFSIEESETFFDEFFSGDFIVERPFMLDITFEHKNGKYSFKNAFNDIVFYRDKSSSMVHIEVYNKGKNFNQYFGDGLIVASPAGSTAYNLSANGPIVYALAEVFILTPVCPHSLTQRPIVLPRGFELEFEAQDCIVCIDGQEDYAMENFKSIKVGLSQKNVALIRSRKRDYFQILKEKLHWGN
ncbi:NAD(+) kinase [Campylobacter sp. MIT 21-1685]|uniref:NAD(+) kinase n=1 Tax=unclassified Campylobacter TaxID=2593542 RepID=UPI00224B2BAB|nr:MULTISPECIES: NAD(+) kinase [unclassified Campylobacter]MCX2682377.1 NAD(+) kinase [Campylobacter sp. MIT 21-1684]MCX2750657.1 NAD(+) kinase [Campylobacter sp. MIT 21-1682]MCX2806795.1 NAD(+) kinase [Campylobacter sp. MIT 21-1685]